MKQNSEMNQILKIKGFWIYEFIDKQSFALSKVCLVALEFVLPVMLIFSIPLIQRFSNVLEYPSWRIFSLLSAASWSFWGPYLIYQYHVQVIKLYQNLSSLKYSITHIFRDTYTSFQKRVAQVSIIWGIVLAWILLIHPETLRPYSLYEYTDVWYWIFLLYVFFSLHLTACGFVGVIYSILLLKKITKNDIMSSLIQKEPRKLKVFGQFMFSIVLYFSSGITFIPILIDFMRANSTYSQLGITIGIGIYTIAICIAFIYPLYLVKQSAQNAKNLLLNKFEAEYIRCLYHRKTYKRSFFQNLNQVNRYNSLCFIQSINIELLDSSKVFTIFTTLILPALLGVVEKMIPSNINLASILNSLFIS